MIPLMTEIRTLLATAAAGLALAGCEAGATDKKLPETSKFRNTETVKKAVAAKALTLLDCLKMENQSEKSACKLEVKAQQEAEIAELDLKETKLDNENAKINTEIEKGNTTNEVLSKKIDTIFKAEALKSSD